MTSTTRLLKTANSGMFVLFLLVTGISNAMAPAAPAQLHTGTNQSDQTNSKNLSADQQKLLDDLKFKKRAQNLIDYFIPIATNTLVNGAVAYKEGGSAALAHGVLKPTIIDTVKDGAKWAGKKSVVKVLKDGLSLSPHRGQKRVVGWGISGLVSGIDYRLRKDNSKNWFSRFVLQKWLPSFVQSQVVHFAYSAITTATNADYPAFVQKSDWLHHLAKIMIPTYAHMALSFMYDQAYSYLVNR